jgi:hypothetical protein
LVGLVESLLVGPDLLGDLDGTGSKDISTNDTEVGNDLSCLRVGDE